MRIAVVHSYYSSEASGENKLVEMSTRVLAAAGHSVRLFSKFSEVEKNTPAYSLRAAARVASGAGRSPLFEIEKFQPDVVHIHNLFPNWSESWVAKLSAPVVVTLHNYRRVCASGTLSLRSDNCTLCPTRGSHNAIINRCYRGSSVKSIPLAIATRNPRSDQLLERSNQVVFITQLAKDALTPFMSPSVVAKSSVVENFIYDPQQAAGNLRETDSRSGWLFIGRLSAEKGIAELLSNWPKGEKLTVVGDGPLKKSLMQNAGANTRFTGFLTESEIVKLLNSSNGLIFPSISREGGVPLSYLESIACSVPVVAKTGNWVAETVTQNDVGVEFEDFSKISVALKDTVANWNRFSRRARAIYEANYTSDVWLDNMVSVYESARENWRMQAGSVKN